MLELFTRQFDVASVAQLQTLGVSAYAVGRAARSGLVERPLPRVVWLPGRVPSLERRAMATQLTRNGSGFVSGLSAGALHGWRGTASPVLHFTIRDRFDLTAPPWLVVHLSSWDDDEPRLVRDDPLIVASPWRALFDIAACTTLRRFATIAEDAWRLGHVEPESLADYLGRHRRSGRPGVTRLREWLDRVSGRSAPTQTGLERFLADCAVEAGAPEPVPQHPLRLGNGVVVHLDLAWPELRWAIEPGHSWYHGGDAAMRSDQERDRWCAGLGWLITRYDEQAMNRRTAVVRELREIHLRRRAEVFGA